MTIGIPSFTDPLNGTDDAANLLVMATMSEVAIDVVAILFAGYMLERKFANQANRRKRDLQEKETFVNTLDQNENYDLIDQNVTLKVSIKYPSKSQLLSYDSNYLCFFLELSVDKFVI